MRPSEAARGRAGSTRQGGIPARLTLTVLPLAVVALLVGLILAWNLVVSDGTEGLSSSDALAVGVGVAVAVVALGSLVAAYRTGLSMAARIDEVTSAARRIGNKDLVVLLDALRTPDPKLDVVPPLGLAPGADDEIGRLARAMEDLHGTLIYMASRQMESLRKGVSAIFVTLARRNSSLVDRQLALLDQLEAREDDPETLGGYYQVDHLAARMRRNAESLLVLAGSESPRVWAKAADMSDVVRAAVSEVDDYQRVEVLALEPARLSGGAVTDAIHLFAELLENAVQFSPPTETVRVTGLFTAEGYQVSVTDRGVGLTDARLAELNRVLERPPALGLAVEPTLGLFVVAKLAHRHGLAVELIRGAPGVTAKVTIPRDLLETGRATEPAPEVIDLTDQALTGSETAAPAGMEPVDQGGGLPVRLPGQAFREQASDEAAVGEGAVSITSALSAYDRGRRAAAEGLWDDGDGEEGT